MKTRLLFTTALASLVMSFQAQTVVFSSNFKTWVGGVPTDWMFTPATNIAADSVKKDSILHATPSTVLLRYTVNLTNTSTTTYKRFASEPIQLIKDSAYMISYSIRGKGEVRAGLFSGVPVDTINGFGYLYSGTESTNAGTWTRYSQSLIADSTITAGQVILSVKETGTSSTKYPPVLTGLEIDSVVVTMYSPKTVSLYNVQYTTLATLVTPNYGKIVRTGGIVTAVYSSGYYIESSNSTIWSGCEVYDFTHTPALGDSLTFTADVDSYYGNTELQTVTNYFKAPGIFTVPAPIVLTCAILNNNNTARQYQGMLVRVDNLQAEALTSYGQWPIIDASATTFSSYTVAIDKQIMVSPAPPIANFGKYTFVQGPLNYNFEYNIEPRDSADIGTLINAGVQNFSNGLVSKMYPNPVSNELTIDLSLSQEKATVTVYDMLGKEVSSPLITSGNQIVLKNINLPSGVYMLKVMANDQAQIMKFVKE